MFSDSIREKLTFFKANIADANLKRVRVASSKNLITYLINNPSKSSRLDFMRLPLGIMSFTLYYSRLLINMALLIERLCARESMHSKSCKELYFAILLDMMWGTCNLLQFFWWAFRYSRALGLRGMQLEFACQIIEFIVFCIQHGVLVEEYQEKIKKATADERADLEQELYHAQLHFLRTAASLLLMTLAIAMIAFSVVSMPLSPVMFAIASVGSLMRILIQLHQEKSMKNHHQKSNCRVDWDGFFVSFIFIPSLLLLLVYPPIFVGIPLILGLIALRYAFNQYIFVDNQEIETVDENAMVLYRQ